MKNTFLLLIACCLTFASCEDLGDIINGIENGENTENTDNNENDGNNDGDESTDVPADLPTFAYTSEDDIKASVDLAYDALRKYIDYQKIVENTIIIEKNFESITPNDANIDKMWKSGYEAIAVANKCIRSLEKSIEIFGQEVVDKYLGTCNAVIGFIYKDMVEHWGNIPIITPESSVSEFHPTAMENEVRAYCAERLELGRKLLEVQNTFINDQMTVQTTMLALAEAKYYDYHIGREMCRIVLDMENTEEIIYTVTGFESHNKIIIYTKKYAELLLAEYSYYLGLVNEAGGDLPQIISRWDSNSYGYWSMLKRTNRLVQSIGCPEYMKYLPIPASELANNPNLMQNPGY